MNIGGSSTGVAFGPATGSGVLSMRQASGLMAVFVLIGGFTIGTNVVDTLGTDFVPAEYFTLGASIGVLLFIGLGILLGNVLRVSTSTSQTAVAAVVGMGAALGVLDWRTVGIVGMWWVLSTILAFWLCAFIGRYFYDAVVDALAIDAREGGTVAELVVIGIGCYMAFSAGASNVANAVAPLVDPGAPPAGRSPLPPRPTPPGAVVPTVAVPPDPPRRTTARDEPRAGLPRDPAAHRRTLRDRPGRSASESWTPRSSISRMRSPRDHHR